MEKKYNVTYPILSPSLGQDVESGSSVVPGGFITNGEFPSYPRS